VDDVLDAIQLQALHKLSFWDAMILSSAVSLGCGTIWSEDLSPGQKYGPVTVQNPFI
jgi:predicted nucleic acid-binding protein